MPTIRHISREEAQRTRTPKAPGVRRQRMNEFDDYARALLDNPDEAVVFEGIEETPQKFVLSLRGAFTRAGVTATVRKMRGRNEVRAWVAPARVATIPVSEPESTGKAPRRGGRQKAAASS